MVSERSPTVLVTRSPHQASELAERLRALGLEPILVPAIEIVPPASFDTLDAALARLEAFHWLIFTSVNAVEAFAERASVSAVLAQLQQRLETVHIAAIGSATASSLRSRGIEPSLIPAQAVAESLTNALLPHALQPEGTPTRFLLVRAEEAREHLPETASLRRCGGRHRPGLPHGDPDGFGGGHSRVFASPGDAA